MDTTDCPTRPQPRHSARWVLYLAVSVFVVIGLLAAADAVTSQARLAGYPSRLASADVRIRRKAVEQISRDREARALPVLVAMLEREQDRELVGIAGNAVLRTRSPAGVDVLRRRADQGLDDEVRANLIVAAARLSNRDVRLLEWLQQGVRSKEPWQAVGSAVGLVELGRTEGGPLAVQQIRGTAAAPRAWALRTLARTANPLCQAVGQPMSWLASTPEAATDAQLNQLEVFWTKRVDSALLCDVLQRVNQLDPEWAEVGRLIHARNKVAKWLQ